MKAGKAVQVARMGLLFALAMALSALEWMIPPAAFLPPGIRLGLSNVVVMYTLCFWGPVETVAVGALKIGFTLLTRGPVAAGMSFGGTLLSILVMLLCKRLKRSDWLLSVGGAVSHNIGQLIVARFLLDSAFVFFYLPVLVLAGVGMGFVTAVLLRAVRPYLARLDFVLKGGPG